MRRREFIALVGGAAAWPRAANAQSEPRRIGVILGFPEHDPQTRLGIQAFLEALKRVGLDEGRNVRIDYAWPGIDPDKTRTFVRELIRRRSPFP